MGLYLKMSIVLLLCAIFVLIYLITKKIEHFNTFFETFKLKYFLLLISILLFGFFYVKMYDFKYESYKNDLQEDVNYFIEAIVVSEATEKDYKYVYEIELIGISENSKYKGQKWLLNIQKENNTAELNYGDLIEFEGKISFPSKARNYMGFDYESYLKSKKIYGTITVSSKAEIIDTNKAGFITTIWNDVRNSIKENINKVLQEDVSGLCIGILIGNKSEISEDVIEEFEDSNLTHMLAVSGAHVSYIILGLTFILQKTGFRFRKIFTILFLCFFMGLTNFTVSVQRACIMAILMLIASLIFRKSDVYINLAISNLIILIINPYAVLNIGFELSYSGTIGIVLLYPKIFKFFCKKLKLTNEEKGIKKLFKSAINLLSVSLSANLAIIPIMLFQFNTLSTLFWFSNLLARPIVWSYNHIRLCRLFNFCIIFTTRKNFSISTARLA